MSRGRMSFAPEACVKGEALFELIGGKTLAREPSPTAANPTGRPEERFKSKLERWAAETSRRLLEIQSEEPGFLAFLTAGRESITSE